MVRIQSWPFAAFTEADLLRRGADDQFASARGARWCGKVCRSWLNRYVRTHACGAMARRLYAGSAQGTGGSDPGRRTRSFRGRSLRLHRFIFCN